MSDSETLSLEMTAPPQQRPRKGGGLAAALLGALVLALVAAVAWCMLGRTPLPQGAVYAAMQPVFAPMNAQVIEVYAHDGDSVQAGQPLAKLDTSAYEKYIAEAQALVGKALYVQAQRADMQQQAQQLKAQEKALVYRLAEARFAEDGAKQVVEQRALEYARATLHRRELDLNHSQHTASQRSAAAQAEQQALAQKNAAHAQFERVSHARAALEQDIRRLREDLAPLQGLQAAPAVAAPMPDVPGLDGTVKAPIAGIVRGSITVGQPLGRDQASVYIAPSVPWTVVVTLPADVARNVHKGQLCSISLPAPYDTTAWGEVDAQPAPIAADSTPPPSTTNGVTSFDLPDGSQSVRINVLTKTNLNPTHGTPVQLHWWRNSLPGFKELVSLF